MSKQSSISSLFKPDDVTRAGASACNAAGQAACREALALVFAESTGAPLAPERRAAAAAKFVTFEAFVSACALLSRALRVQSAHGADEGECAAALAALGLEAPIAADAAGAARRGRGALVAASGAAAPRGVSVDSVRWRVDVTISSSAQNRVMRPAVLMQLQLSDGACELFDVPLEHFHALRYSCAKALSEMGAIEGHPVLRIQ